MSMLLMGCGGDSAGASPPATGTWNPADKAASISLSAGDLQADATVGGFNSVRSTTSHSSGLYGWAFQCSGTTAFTTSLLVGFGKSTATLADYVGSDANGCGWYNQDGHLLISASPVVNGNTYPSSAGLTFLAVTKLNGASTGKVWFWDPFTSQWNGDVIGAQNPATDTGGAVISAGTYFAMFSGNSSAPGDSFCLANFATPNSHPAWPAGASAWG